MARKLSKAKVKLLQEAVSERAIRAKPIPERVFTDLEALDEQRLIKLVCEYYFVKWTLTTAGRAVLTDAGRDALNAQRS